MPGLRTSGWTVEMLDTLPDDGKRYEIVDGELLVTPAPTVAHQRIVGALYRRLYAYLERSAVGEVIFSPADVRSGPRTSVQPDLFVIRRPARSERHGWPHLDALLLAIEVISPSTARADRGVKRQLCQRAGVPEYWIVDLDARLIERWRPSDERPEVLRETIEWRVEERTEPVVMELAALFGEAFGER